MNAAMQGPTKLTKIQRQHYLSSHGMCCPHCKSANIKSTGSGKKGFGWLFMKSTCENCGNEWHELYTLADIEVGLEDKNEAIEGLAQTAGTST